MHLEDTRRLFEQARGQFGEDVTFSEVPRDEGSVVVAPSRLREFTQWARSQGFDFFADIGGIDYLYASPRFDLTYTVYSTGQKRHLHYKVKLAASAPA